MELQRERAAMFTFILAPLGKDYLHHSGWALEKEKVAGNLFSPTNFASQNFLRIFKKKILSFHIPPKIWITTALSPRSCYILNGF